MKQKSDYQKKKLTKTTRGRVSCEMKNALKDDLAFKKSLRNKKIKYVEKK